MIIVRVRCVRMCRVLQPSDKPENVEYSFSYTHIEHTSIAKMCFFLFVETVAHATTSTKYEISEIDDRKRIRKMGNDRVRKLEKKEEEKRAVNK